MDREQADLGQLVLDVIRANPEQHDQTSWAVRYRKSARYDIAGWAVVMSELSLCWISDDDGIAFAECLSDGRFVNEVARGLLGLSASEADQLFLQCNETEAVSMLQDLVTAARGEEVTT